MLFFYSLSTFWRTSFHISKTLIHVFSLFFRFLLRVTSFNAFFFFCTLLSTNHAGISRNKFYPKNNFRFNPDKYQCQKVVVVGTESTENLLEENHLALSASDSTSQLTRQRDSSRQIKERFLCHPFFSSVRLPCDAPVTAWRLASWSNRSSPIGWGCRIHRLHLYKGVRPPPPNECPRYDIKPSEGEATALEIRGMWITVV